MRIRILVESTTNGYGDYDYHAVQLQGRVAVSFKLECQDDESNVDQCMTI